MKNIKIWVLSLLFAAAVPFTVDAQVYQSKSYSKKTTITKKEDTCRWKKFQAYVDAGVRIPTTTLYDYEGIKLNYRSGFELDLGFQLRMGCKGWYWGMSGSFFTSGLSTPRGYSYDYGYWEWGDYIPGNRYEREGGSSTIYGGQLNFTTFGWRTMLSKDVMLDINLGLAIEGNSEGNLDNAGNIDYARAGIARFCLPIGVGVQIKKFRINAKYQIAGGDELTGNAWTEYGDNVQLYEEGSQMWNSFRLTVGYAF